MNTWIQACRLSALLLGMASVSGQAAAQWTITTLDRAAASNTQLWGINDSNQIVGSDSLGGFVYSGGVASAMPDWAGAEDITPFGIANDGTIVGSWTSPGDGLTHGFIYKAGSYAGWDLGLSGLSFTQIRSISLDGRYIAGYATGDTAGSTGFVFDTLSAQLTTYSTNGIMILQGSTSSGLTAGSLAASSGVNGGVLAFDSGTYTVYPGMPGVAGRISFRGINDAGMMSGYTNNGGVTTAVFGSVTRGYAFSTMTISGAVSSFGEGLNNHDAVVGFYSGADGFNHGFLATPVPEPTTALLLASGLATLAWRRRQTQKTTAR
jgi:PEP-CTERM motif